MDSPESTLFLIYVVDANGWLTMKQIILSYRTLLALFMKSLNRINKTHKPMSADQSER
ncbi:hypothetical protein [Marinobacter nitratireducens]|uniref:hypothetical protein n=1 Tax=Marinobacter nitratireducens TaxID=1137280 RepID=UPI0013636238|nr:hypothetical protein [Marinobacter nitratireducens]